MRCELGARAFITIVASAIEVYKKETFGVLLGKKKKKNVIEISSAINLQTASRSYSKVVIDTVKENRIRETLNFISGHKVVGQFHSHPDYPNSLSVQDKAIMKAHDEMISLLVVLDRDSKIRMWKANRDKSISGTVGGKYYVKIYTFYYKKGMKNVKKIPVHCHYMNRLNKLISKCAHYEKGVCVWKI